ncbi:MAG: hypothetical protein EOP49_15170 [Sphingobacteriales bacterium]|nr:MAG: hypothetical protein EOP49_15170 [Sphingobacteriales bacterium]
MKNRQEELNRQVAEYMGAIYKQKKDPFSDWKFDVMVFPKGVPLHFHFDSGCEELIVHLQYHKSWDWLIPVWVKACNDAEKLDIAHAGSSARHNIRSSVKDFKERFAERVILNRISSAFDVVLEVIQFIEKHKR